MTDATPATVYFDRDVPCRRCGYNLRGLAELGRCPECHAPVVLALLPEHLPIIDPECVECLARGCRIATWGICAFLISFIGLAALCTVSVVLGQWDLDADAVGRIWLVFGIVCLTASAIGLWIATRPHPTFREPSPGISPRRLARLCLGILPVTVVSSWFTRSILGWSSPLVPIAIGSPVGLFGLIGLWSFARYVESVARGINDPISQRKAPWYRWAFASAWLLGWAGAAGATLHGGVGFILAMVLGAIGVFAFACLTIGLTTYLNAALPGYLLAAKANWEEAERRAEG